VSRQFLPNRWKQIAPLLDAALEREHGDRSAFLDHACAGDPGEMDAHRSLSCDR